MSLPPAKLSLGSRIYPWMCFAILCLAYAFSNIVRYSPAVIVTDLTRDLGIGPAEIGFLSALALWGFASAQLPFGVISDTLGVRLGLSIFLFIAAAGTFLFGIAPSYVISAIGRCLMGIGTGIVLVSALKFFSLMFPVTQFATLNGLITVFGSLGTVFAAAPLTFLVDSTGWRSCFVVLAIFAATIALLVFATLRDKQKGSSVPITDRAPSQSNKTTSQKAGIGTVARSVLTNSNLWLLGITAFVVYGATLAIQGLWGISFLVDTQQLPKQTASNIMSIIPLGVIIGAPIMAYLSDRIFHTRKWLIFASILLVSLVYAILAVIPPGQADWMYYLIFFCLGLFNSAYSLVFALVHDIVPHETAGSSLGFFNMWNFVGGAIYQPVTGFLLALFPVVNGHIPIEGYRALFAFCIVGVLIGALALVLTKVKKVDPLENQALHRQTV